MKLPPATGEAIRLVFDGPIDQSPGVQTGIVEIAGCTIAYEADRMAGLPNSIVFTKTRKAFTDFAWNDRLHHSELGGFLLRNDKQARTSIVSSGPICTVVRMQAAYKRADGTSPESRPQAIYDWYFFHDQPLVFVTAHISQSTPFAWNEVHFLELNFPGRDFTQWAGADPAQGGALVADSSSHRYSDWAAVIEGQDAIGMFGCGPVLVHDGRGQYGTYLHAAGDRSWQAWNGTRRSYSGWLWIGTDEAPQEAIRAWQQRFPLEVPAVLTLEGVHQQIEAARYRVAQLPTADGAVERWRVAMACRLETEGRFDDALAALQGAVPADWTILAAGDLRLALRKSNSGVCLRSLFDARAGHEHLPPAPLPLFGITLRDAQSQQQLTLEADRGWQQTAIHQSENGSVEIHWQTPENPDVGNLQVIAQVIPDHANDAVRWQLTVAGQREPWSLWRVLFPQLELVAPGTDPVILFPRGPGEVQSDVWHRTFSFRGTYPGGWTTMQFMAVYDSATGNGLYTAVQDPLGGTKDLSAESRPTQSTVVVATEFPVPDMGKAGNQFQLNGEAVWQLFSGDWFDAARIYRGWVQKHAHWYPTLGPDGREDTPLWMRELCVWAQTGGSAADCGEPVRRFAEYLGVPVGFHWYRWHQIPFDNDYPHYFPTTDGFVEEVRKLRKSNVYVMPYINGRLWDTRDRGVEDFEFTKRALSAATKDDKGQPYTEMYGSKESDGSRVSLAVMCPSTSTWQNEVNEIVVRLFDQCDVSGVYIDQIAAASPKTCMDPSHGHPWGGGHWWNEGYWKMLENMRRGMKPDRMLTSECNAEPFVRWFDGYLTWHWQYDGQVPAFPAVYGGAIQMFGRAYRGGETGDLALHMKSAQQLVFGEQIGWLDPRVVDQPENAEFLRQIVRLRWQLRRYFYAGEMLRPPRLAGDIPKVRADWQWQNTWWVETDALLTGAWRLPQENKVVVIFANVTDQRLQAKWSLEAYADTLAASQVNLLRITADGPKENAVVPATFDRQLDVPPRSAWAWEISPAR